MLGHGYLFWRFFSEGGDVDSLYIAYKKPLAEEHMEKLKRAIAVNPYTRFWQDNNPQARSVIDYRVTFNEQREDGEYVEWRAQADPEGIMAASRGRHPKIVICDDILSDFANPLESAEIEHINQIFEYVVMSLPPVDGTLGVFGYHIFALNERGDTNERGKTRYYDVLREIVLRIRPEDLEAFLESARARAP